MDKELNIELKLNENERGEFYIERNGESIATMEVAIKENKLVVYHTKVSDELKGLNIGRRMIDDMVKYAREKNLKVIPLCPFVNAQFRRHEKEYGDVWMKEIK